MLISDRATVSLPKSNITTGKGDSKICVESGASLTASFYTASTNGSNNEFRVTSGATAAISKFRFSTSGNTLVIDNATYDMGTAADRSFTLAAAANCSSNVVVIRGAQAQAPLMADASSYNLNIFGAGHDNALVLENGAVWDPGSVETFMKSCTNSAFIVRGSGTEFGAAANRFYTGSRYNVGDVASRNNRIEISDGATFKASRFCVQGIGTEVVVSNATLEVDSPFDESFGLRLGFAAAGASLTTNNMMVLRGESPQVKVTGNPADTWQCRVSDGSTLRFEVPETGYSTVPLTAECQIVVVGTSKIEIDCADFCEKTGGKVQLMHSDADIPQTTQDVLACVALPEGARIIVDGGDVYLKSPRHQGLILMVR